MINDNYFQGEESHLLLNPRLPKQEYLKWQAIQEYYQEFPGHLWLATSGSTEIKLVALSKKAILASAQAVNQHLQVTSQDVWINPLPSFHVGGLGIYARAHLNHAKVYSFVDRWSLVHFYEFLTTHRGTLTSLVPTQVYDIVMQRLQAPSHLRAVVVGGGALQESLYQEARKLGWPLLSSYGMTECASQVATASLKSLENAGLPSLELLPHIEIKSDESQRLHISSPALLTAYATYDEKGINVTSPVNRGWLITQDRGVIEGKVLKLLGRIGDFVKIGGESVEFGRLEKIFEELKLQHKILYDVVIGLVPDERLGHVIHLFSTDESFEDLLNQYNAKVLPYERIRKVHLIPEIPRSPLKKVLRNELIRLSK